MDLMDIELDAQIERELQDDDLAKTLKFEATEEQEDQENINVESDIKYEEEDGGIKMAEIEFEAIPRPTALFLRGVDEMSTTDIKDYCDSKDLVKVEWINDTSCNLVFNDREKASQALQSLLQTPSSSIDHKTLHPSKTFTNADDKTMNLFIRIASDEDVKEKGARERSRYYLLHGTEDSDVDRNVRGQDIEERMKKNGGDGRDVFSRLGNKIALSSASLSNRRQRDRSASPIRQETRQTREIPERLRNRLGGVKVEEQLEEQENTDRDDDNIDIKIEDGSNNFENNE